jgi:transposase
LELVSAAGIALAAKEIGNDSAGFAEALAWIAEHAPGPRIAVALEGTRSYGVGLARALNAAGLTVIEVEQPVVVIAATVNPTRLTRIWPRCTRCE